jgi:hypothetical protein
MLGVDEREVNDSRSGRGGGPIADQANPEKISGRDYNSFFYDPNEMQNMMGSQKMMMLGPGSRRNKLKVRVGRRRRGFRQSNWSAPLAKKRERDGTLGWDVLQGRCSSLEA